MATTRTSTIFGDAKIASNVGVITAARALTVDESGNVFPLNLAAGVALTLPAVATAKGVKYKFYVQTAFATTAYTIVSTGNVIQGGAIVNSVNVPAANENTITFAANAETIGDWLELECDGVYWYAKGVGTAAGAITFTAP